MMASIRFYLVLIELLTERVYHLGCLSPLILLVEYHFCVLDESRRRRRISHLHDDE